MELINIEQYSSNQDAQCISARQLHEKLEVKGDFSSWIKYQIESLDLEENVDYIVFLNNGENLAQDGRPKTEYVLTLDTANLASRKVTA